MKFLSLALSGFLYSIFWIIGGTASLLPWRVRQGLAFVLGGIWFWILPFRRRVILHNLSLVFPRESGESMDEFRDRCNEIARRNMRHNILFLIEFLERFHWAPADVERRLVIQGWEHVEGLMHSKRGAFIMTAHIGNWELMTVAGSLKGMPLSILTRFLRNPVFDRIWVWSRRRFGMELLQETGSGMQIIRAIRKGRFVGFIMDQHTGEPHGLETEFLGLPAWSPKGLAILATRLDAPVLPACILRRADGRFDVKIAAPIEVPAALAPQARAGTSSGRTESGPLSLKELESHVRLCNQVMEGWIREHAEQYLWLHKRFKNFVDYRARLPWEL